MSGRKSDGTVPGRPGPDVAWRGGRVLEVAHCVLAPNPGPMTLDGTNTWVVGDLAGGEVVVIDPGPDDTAHLDAVRELVAGCGARIAGVLLTHGHADHSEAAATFARSCRVGVLALDPRHRLGAEGLTDGDVVDAGGVRLDVLATPGHTADSLSFVVSGASGGPAPAVLTGDAVLGRGTAVIDHPDGVLGDYLVSLERLRRTVRSAGAGLLLPGHGPVLTDPDGVLRAYQEHRAARLAAVRAALDDGARTTGEVVERVYADVPRHLWPMAERSVRAALVHLGRAED